MKKKCASFCSYSRTCITTHGSEIVKIFCSEHLFQSTLVDSSWNVMTLGDIRDSKWRGNWRMEWVASTLHTTSEHVVSSITTADAHTSAACIRLNWRPLRFKWTRPFRRKTKSGFGACAVTFQIASTHLVSCKCVTGLFPRGKAAGAWRWSVTPSTAEI